MINIELEDMVEALNQNPLAMEQAKVAALMRENTTLRAMIEQLEIDQKESEPTTSGDDNDN